MGDEPQIQIALFGEAVPDRQETGRTRVFDHDAVGVAKLLLQNARKLLHGIINPSSLKRALGQEP